MVLSDLLAVMECSSELGLQLNPTKCELLVLGQCDPETVQNISSLLPGLKLLDAASCNLLGAPLTPEALLAAISSKANANVSLGGTASIIAVS